ncbi:bifunctional diaminohydroxyphosphoribosylaminopyrimidine deaminase/5-amino-6-(5-phosphoribosylamino)uracil reductase RibD [Vibrio maritimus]|uniref:bifunctional diaminohydroxyphosphoribosylaminopyrimidine deaminase/5-amino-6-(5-phosphoribosylamino)uracil reductase RibD n=1 Tax=Vibrio maritimus TaxID=990268 RepID=UPI001F018CE4|nr:bifunctional diaminohydroxyphosphoribosylaminopyrimidine deaminase/5-amino-6-(5-phosphoribosylamino)uracil reductase RibD [Vibrio maritimus]
MSQFSAIDHQMMSLAIDLARKGRFTTAPNPNVGCVITLGDEIVGHGYHKKAGEPHAEVHAMRMAGDKAKGATAYVTLEPCSHYGRTPPCAEGLIKAGVAKVVCAMSDPNPQVAGRGFAMLEEAGIEVHVGLLELDARALNPGFLKKMETQRPFVQLKMAASLDGQTALANGKSQWITGPEARKDVQAYRAQAGAILSTSKTVIDDNASLNVRWDELPSQVKETIEREELRQPTRVILDRHHQLTEELKLFQSTGPIIRVANQGGDLDISLTSDEQLDLAKTLDALAAVHQINHVWVEAGATLASSMMQAQLVDELIVYLAPKLMGADGRGLIGALGLEEMQDVIDLNIKDIRMVGKDIRIVATPQLTKN